MKSILAPAARPVLAELVRERALLAFDFDGTLAPIVADRTAAVLREETRRLLRALAILHPCAVISGRSRADVAARLVGVPLVAVVGNHGAEAGRGPRDRTRCRRLAPWKALLERELRGAPGIEIEDKGFSIAVHYRAAPSRATARRLVLGVSAGLDGARVFGGRAVVNLVPSDAPDKAAALTELVQRFGARRALYVGDDRTDEDVFRRCGDVVRVRVGLTRRSAAEFYVPGQAAVDDLLRALVRARTQHDGMGDRCEGLTRAVGQ